MYNGLHDANNENYYQKWFIHQMIINSIYNRDFFDPFGNISDTCLFGKPSSKIGNFHLLVRCLFWPIFSTTDSLTHTETMLHPSKHLSIHPSVCKLFLVIASSPRPLVGYFWNLPELFPEWSSLQAWIWFGLSTNMAVAGHLCLISEETMMEEFCRNLACMNSSQCLDVSAWKQFRSVCTDRMGNQCWPRAVWSGSTLCVTDTSGQTVSTQSSLIGSTLCVTDRSGQTVSTQSCLIQVYTVCDR